MITANAVSQSFNLSFTLLALWVVALSRTNNVFYIKLKNECFLHTSATHFSMIFSLFHAFSNQNIKLFFSLHTQFTAISFCIFTFLCRKINEATKFLQTQELLILLLYFSLLFCVLILTFFVPIVCTLVDVGIFKYMSLIHAFHCTQFITIFVS